jgi:hypothetical protein
MTHWRGCFWKLSVTGDGPKVSGGRQVEDEEEDKSKMKMKARREEVALQSLVLVVVLGFLADP